MFGITHECDYEAVCVDHESILNHGSLSIRRNWTHILWGCKCGDICVETVQGTWTLGDIHIAKGKK